MNYKDNDMYKAFRLKLKQLEREAQGQNHDHTISKLGMFAEDAFSEQQATLDRLERENDELLLLLRKSLSASKNFLQKYPDRVTVMGVGTKNVYASDLNELWQAILDTDKQAATVRMVKK